MKNDLKLMGDGRHDEVTNFDPKYYLKYQY